MKYLIHTILLTLCCGWSGTALAETCDEAISSTTPSTRFAIQAQARTVRDDRTGLTWQRCPLGYVIDHQGTDTILDDACVIDDAYLSSLAWQQALQDAVSFDQANGDEGWRVPNQKELLSIVEFKCVAPAINGNLFPDTPPVLFWTSSAAHNTSGAKAIDFGSGKLRGQPTDRTAMLRLVLE